MSNLKKTHEPIRQNGQNVKKSQKHETNLQKNSTFYFQIGLIVCLLAAYGLLEMKFEATIPKIVKLLPPEDIYYVDIPIVKPEVPVYNEPIEQKRVKQPQNYKEVENDTPDLPFLDEPKEPVIDAPDINLGDLDPVEEPIEEVIVDFIRIEQVPIYPGCEKEKNNADRKKCMSEKITKLVQKKFDSDLATELGLSGKQVIRTQFTIDKTGHVTNIKTRGTHPELEKEAERVINIIPEMIPGKQRDKNVGVIYTLPIIFQVQ